MSKYVKDLITSDSEAQLDGVNDALLVNVVGLDAKRTTKLREGTARRRTFSLMVVKNSLARRATEGTRWPRPSRASKGTLAMVWGGDDIVSLAKEVTASRSKKLEKFDARGGAMDGDKLKARARSSSQQVAQPRGAAQPAGRPDPRRRVQLARRPIDRRRRCTAQPDQAASE